MNSLYQPCLVFSSFSSCNPVQLHEMTPEHKGIMTTGRRMQSVILGEPTQKKTESIGLTLDSLRMREIHTVTSPWRGSKSRVSHSWSRPSGVTVYQTATWEPCDIFKAFDWLRMLKVKLIQNLKLFKNGFVCRLQPFTSASSTCPTLTACTTLTFHQEKLHIYEHVIYVLIDYTLVVILKMNGYNSQQGDNSNLINMVCPFLQSSLAVHQ